MYYQNDLSLSEIAEEQKITRQAVNGQLKIVQRILLDYEEKLGLVEKFISHKKAVKEIKDIAQKIEDCKFLDKDIICNIKKIKDIADEILD